MYNYYTETSPITSLGSMQLSDPNKVPPPPMSIKSGLSLNLDSEVEKSRSRVLSLSDLALEAVSPVLSLSANNSSKTDAQNIMTTPTPTEFLFPRSVTAEQEAYASGFALALEEIYRAEGRPRSADSIITSVTECQQTKLDSNSFDAWQISSAQSGKDIKNGCRMQLGHIIPPDCVTKTHQNTLLPAASDRLTISPCSITNVSGSAGGFKNSSVSSSSHNGSCLLSTVGTVGSVSESTVPNSGSYIPPADFTNCLSKLSSGSRLLSTDSTVLTSAPSVPITVNMQDQDRWRLERKRAKNRVAAARCQMRKIERISKLEDKARDLRNYNAQLAQTAAVLHQHVVRLQKQIMSHTERGCRLLVPSLQ